MFSSTASSHSSSGIFGFPPVFGEVNQKRDAFAPETLCSETVFGSPTGMPNYGGTLAWTFGQTSSPLSCTITYGAPSYTDFESSMTSLGFSPVHPLVPSSTLGEGNQKGDSFASKTLGSADTFASPIGMSNSYGTSTWALKQTSSPLSATMVGIPSSYSLGSSTSNGSQGTRSTFSFKPSDCGGQKSGSRIVDYKRTAEATSSAEKLVSISAMPVYKAKSHEELRWEDYKFTGKGGFGLNSSAVVSASPSLSPFSSSSVANFSTTSWGSTSISTTLVKPNLFGKTFTSLATETTAWKFPGPTQRTKWNFPGPTSSSFTSQPLQFSSSANTSLTKITAAPLNSFNPFVPRTTILSPNSTASTSCITVSLTPTSFTTQPLPFSSSTNTSSTTVTTVPLSLFNPFVQRTTLTSPSSTASSVSVAPLNHNPFTNPFTSLPTQTSSLNFSSPTFPAFTSSLPSTPSSLNAFWSTPIGGLSISMANAAANSVLVPPVSSVLSSTCNQPTTLFDCVPSTQNCNGAITGIIGHSSVAQLSSSKITSIERPSAARNPFGTLPPKPQMIFEGYQSTQSIQYGISSMPVKDKPAPVRYPLLTTRHLSRRSKLPVRKYDPKLNGSKMPYFNDNKETPVPVYVPRENPRALVVYPEKCPLRASTENLHVEKFSGSIYETEMDDSTKEKEVSATVTDVPATLQQPDYYTEPQISELEAKERDEPGFCRRVKDFVVGRRGYGSIKFLGETDVRKLHLETLVQFNNREVIVYMDESKKPPVGEGLNKPAEITLLNIKCIDKRSGTQCMDGSKIDKYINVLKKKAVAQGAEFMSYEPAECEWKFRVQHF